jgi:shikimate dehydrogenase
MRLGMKGMKKASPSKKKKLLAVIGDPVSHSLSPLIQNAAIKKLKLPYEYQAIRVKPEQLKTFMRTRAKKLAGFNVTIPHKEAILPYLDRLAVEAKMIGAVNTIMQRNGTWVGFNTDGSGYLLSLQQDKKFNPRGRHVTLLGAGGAARAIANVLGLNRAKSITIANRTLSRANPLVMSLKKNLPQVEFQCCSLEDKRFESALQRSHLLINTTSVGLKGTSFPSFPWKKLRTDALVSDIVYTPRMTPFLKAAKKAGHPIHTGEGMLIYQGALALELWTGHRPDVRLMRRVLLKKLGA